MASLSALNYGGNAYAMESQVTLVDTSAYGTPHTVVSFVRDDMKNTRILSADERVLYTVATDVQTNAHTIVRRALADGVEGDGEGVIVAEVKRRDLQPDTVRFGGTPKIRLKEWLRGDGGKWSDFPVSFECQSTRYTWRTNSARQIALYEDPNPLPIAWFQTSRRDIVDGVPTIFRALLALQPAAQGILDSIVVSLLVVEYDLRWREMKYRNADGRATFKHSV